MSARERLIELLKQKSCMFVPCDEECDGCGNAEMYESEIESIADYLLANGVIVPPCKEYSFADLENTEYCTKTERKKTKGNNDGTI